MPVLPRDPDIDMCARKARGLSTNYCMDHEGVVFLRKRTQIRSHVVDRRREMV